MNRIEAQTQQKQQNTFEFNIRCNWSYTTVTQANTHKYMHLLLKLEREIWSKKQKTKRDFKYTTTKRNELNVSCKWMHICIYIYILRWNWNASIKANHKLNWIKGKTFILFIDDCKKKRRKSQIYIYKSYDLIWILAVDQNSNANETKAFCMYCFRIFRDTHTICFNLIFHFSNFSSS